VFLTCFGVVIDQIAKLRIDGIIWGSPYIEVIDSNAIQASTGFSALVSSLSLVERYHTDNRSTTRVKDTSVESPTLSRPPCQRTATLSNLTRDNGLVSLTSARPRDPCSSTLPHQRRRSLSPLCLSRVNGRVGNFGSLSQLVSEQETTMLPVKTSLD
jgi:hypothetical protein